MVIMAVRSLVLLQSIAQSIMLADILSTLFTLWKICPTMKATITASAPTARPADAVMRWLTALVTLLCKILLKNPVLQNGIFGFLWGKMLGDFSDGVCYYDKMLL